MILTRIFPTQAERNRICFLYFFLLVSALFPQAASNMNTFAVFADIQTAVDNANAGETVTVFAGTYTQSLDVTRINDFTLVSHPYLTGGDSTAVILAGTNLHNGITVSGTNITVSGITFESWSNGMYIRTAAVSNRITGNIFDRCFNGLLVIGTNCDHNIFESNDFNYNSNYGFALYYGISNLIENNRISSNSYRGMYFGDYAGSNIFRLNTVLSNGSDAFYLSHETADNISIISNRFWHNMTSAITIKDGDHCLILGNLIYSNDQKGIYFSDDAMSNRIFNNRIFSNMGKGIQFQSSLANYNLIYSNEIYSNDQEGIWLRYADYNVVYRNLIHHNRLNGIHLWTTSISNNIINNTIADNGGSGIYFFSSASGRLANNILSSNLDYAIDDNSSEIYSEYNLFFDNQPGSNSSGNMTEGAGNIYGTDPKLNGGYLISDPLSVAVDSAIVIPGITDGYSGVLPDRGWKEYIPLTPPPPKLKIYGGSGNPGDLLISNITNDLVLLHIVIETPTNEDIILSNLIIRSWGSGDDLLDITTGSLRLLQDDGNGTFEGAEPPIGPGQSFSSDDGTAVFTDLTHLMSAGSTNHFLLLADFNGNAGVSNDFNFELDPLGLEAYGNSSNQLTDNVYSPFKNRFYTDPDIYPPYFSPFGAFLSSFTNGPDDLLEICITASEACYSTNNDGSTNSFPLIFIVQGNNTNYTSNLSGSGTGPFSNTYAVRSVDGLAYIYAAGFDSASPANHTVTNLGSFLVIVPRVATNLNTGRDYFFIQSALDEAAAGETVAVFNGNYAENLLFTNKQQVTLTAWSWLTGGDNTTVVLSSAGGPCIELSNTINSLIQGFSIFSNVLTGICVNDLSRSNKIINNIFASSAGEAISGKGLSADGNLILSNRITSVYSNGISILSAADWDIYRNLITFVSNTPLSSGIFIGSNSGGHRIYNNTFYGNMNGLRIVNGQAEVKNNIFCSNLQGGISLDGTGSNDFAYNIFYTNLVQDYDPGGRDLGNNYYYDPTLDNSASFGILTALSPAIDLGTNFASMPTASFTGLGPDIGYLESSFIQPGSIYLEETNQLSFDIMTGDVYFSGYVSNSAVYFPAAQVYLYTNGGLAGTVGSGTVWSTNLSTVLLPDGTNIFRFSTVSPLQETNSCSLTNLVDNSPPAVTETNISAEAVVSAGITYGGTAWDNVSSITGVVFLVNGMVQAYQAGGSTYSFSLDTGAFTNGPLVAGIRISNEVGLYDEHFMTNHVSNISGSLSVVFPSNYSYITMNTVITGYISPGSYAPMAVFMSNSNTSDWQEVYLNVDSWWTNLDPTDLTEGLNELFLMYTNVNGDLVGPYSLLLNVDLSVPVLSLSNLLPGQVISEGITLEGTCSDQQSPVTAVAVVISNQSGYLSNINAVISNDNFSFDWDIDQLSAGSYYLFFSARNAAGLTAAVGPLAVTVDNSPPLIAETNTAAAAVLSGNNRFSGYSSNVSPLSGPNSNFFSSNGVNWLLINTGSGWTFDIDTLSYPDGQAVFYFSAVNIYRRTNIIILSNLIDNSPPLITVDNLQSNQILYQKYTINGTALDSQDGIAGLYIMISNRVDGTVSNYTPGNGPAWSVTWDGRMLQTGAADFYISAVNTAGLSNTMQLVFSNYNLADYYQPEEVMLVNSIIDLTLNPEAEIIFKNPKAGNIKIDCYSIHGGQVFSIPEKYYPSGYNALVWTDVPENIENNWYYLIMESADWRKVLTIIFTR